MDRGNVQTSSTLLWYSVDWMALLKRIKLYSHFFSFPIWHITSSCVSPLFNFSPSCPLTHSILHSVTPLFLQPLSRALARSSVSLSVCHSVLYTPCHPLIFPQPHCHSSSCRLFKFWCIATVCLSITLLAFHLNSVFHWVRLPAPSLSLYFTFSASTLWSFFFILPGIY